MAAYAHQGNVSELIKRKLSQKKYHLPVIGHFAEKSVQFENIIEASRVTGLHPTLTK